MQLYKADLHNHTLLSPCGDIEMTPRFIVSRALERGYDIIGITDHNSTLQGREIRRFAGDSLFILCGAEITTKEEAHCLAFVDREEDLDKLQRYLEDNLVKQLNNVDVFGYQLLVNEDEEVLKEEQYLLISPINKSVDEIEKFVHSLGGIFIPAHLDKKRDSLISQLGFVPFDLDLDAIELSPRCNPKDFISQYGYLQRYNVIQSSDAHYCDDFATCETLLEMESISFEQIKMALRDGKLRNNN